MIRIKLKTFNYDLIVYIVDFGWLMKLKGDVRKLTFSLFPFVCRFRYVHPKLIETDKY